MKPSMHWLAISLASIGLAHSLAQAQAPLPDGWDQAVAAINERSVTATIAFLASDELAGRGTPSEGYHVASAYVAARFRGTGLVGGMPDGSYYQSRQLPVVRVPTDGVALWDAAGKPLDHAGLLAAGAEPVDFQGTIPLVDLQADLEGAEWQGPVRARWGPSNASGQRAAAQLARAVNLWHDAGATALLLYVDAESPLLEVAAQNRARARLDSPRTRFPFPVLLVVGDPPLELEARLSLPARIASEATVRNVIGVLPGADEALREQAIVFSAHLDHLGEAPNATDDWIYNGADDNASGSTAVVTLADAYSALAQSPARTLIFIAFWGEESGLLGSRHFVEEPTWPLEKIVANVNIEMIGRPEPGAHEKIWMTGWRESDLGTLMRDAAAQRGFEIFEHPNYSAMLYRASDNWAFAQRGVVAHSFSAGSLHTDYHQPSDEWEKLDIPHMTRVIQSLFWGSLPLANGEATPQATSRTPSD